MYKRYKSLFQYVISINVYVIYEIILYLFEDDVSSMPASIIPVFVLFAEAFDKCRVNIFISDCYLVFDLHQYIVSRKPIKNRLNSTKKNIDTYLKFNL